MAVNKVEINGATVLDLTEDSVTPETLAEGVTAHDAAGNPIVGTYAPPVTSVNGQTGDVEIKSSDVSVTLLASGWDTSGDWPKYTLALTGITADSNQEYLPPVNPSTEVVEALQAALFQDGGQAAGVAYILAYGEVPTIDLPIRVILRGVL